ncbi:hypothetical protein NE865_11005 [Phthorimaea operculella]|nr:hypothetical protein NE865_11005 [Phthorimaea operculella]
MSANKIFLVSWALVSLFGISQSDLVDSIEPCSIKDSECLTKLYQKMIAASGNGIPEIGMGPTDPYALQNESVTVLNLVTISMIDGSAKGIKDCVIHKVNADLDTRNFTMDFTCSMVIKGKYRVTSNPGIKNIIGGEVKGEGLGKVEIDKVHIKAGFEFFASEGADGELYFDYNYEGMKFVFSFGRTRFYGNSLFIGGQDNIKPILQMLNNNWRFILTTFGQPFVQYGMDIFFKYTHMFYDNVPAKKYIIEDLSHLLK